MTDTPGHHTPVDYHAALLSDPWRVAAWNRAIHEVVRPGQVVLDVGTGTGVMAVWAARAGASVHAIESSWAARVAERAMRDSGVADRVTVHHADIAAVPPVPADVILCDPIGRWLPEGDLRHAIGAAARWATPETRWLPERIDLVTAPIGDLALPAIDRLTAPVLGADVSAAAAAALGTPWAVQLATNAVVADPIRVHTLRPDDLPAMLQSRARWTLDRPTRLRGVAGWFVAHLTPTVQLDTGPGRRTFWGQTAWPCPAYDAVSGDVIDFQVTARSEPGAVHFAWRICIERAGQVVLDHHADADPADPPVGPGADWMPSASSRAAARLAHLRAGREALAAGDAATAAFELGRASTLGDGPIPADVLADLGRAHLRSGDATSAAATLVAADATPGSQAHRDLIDALAALGDPAVQALLGADR